MIITYNPDKLTRQSFFQELINYLQMHDEVTLRQIKRDFPEIPKLDRAIEDYVQAGYVARQDKRYTLTLPLLEKAEQVSFDDMVFVDTHSPAYDNLLALTFYTQLANVTNQVILEEKTDFARSQLTMSNYFHKLRTALPLSPDQEKLYAILGDVNQEYALKYMTAFLLKFERKAVVKQKRPDIFVQALVLLGYLEQIDEQSYGLKMAFDREKLIFSNDLF